VETLVAMWSNNRWGWGRRVIWLRTDGATWWVEAQQGHADRSTPWRRQFDSEQAARDQVDAMIARTPDDAWRLARG
jgi:hypothetical protein